MVTPAANVSGDSSRAVWSGIPARAGATPVSVTTNDWTGNGSSPASGLPATSSMPWSRIRPRL